MTYREAEESRVTYNMERSSSSCRSVISLGDGDHRIVHGGRHIIDLRFSLLNRYHILTLSVLFCIRVFKTGSFVYYSFLILCCALCMVDATLYIDRLKFRMSLHGVFSLYIFSFFLFWSTIGSHVLFLVRTLPRGLYFGLCGLVVDMRLVTLS